MTGVVLERGADIDETGTYRYGLWRIWDTDKPRVGWLLLNPSTADGQADDPTVRRCIGFARCWGYGGILIRNLFAYRATHPSDLLKAPDPIGPNNDHTLAAPWPGVNLFVAGWGASPYAGLNNRWIDVAMLMAVNDRQLHCVSATKDGHPCHPLYQPRVPQPMLWSAPPAEEGLT